MMHYDIIDCVVICDDSVSMCDVCAVMCCV